MKNTSQKKIKKHTKNAFVKGFFNLKFVKSFF